MRHLLRHHRRPGLRFRRRWRYLGGHCPRPSSRPLRRSSNSEMIRILLPFHLRTLAGVNGEVQLPVADPPTLGSVLDAVESTYPVLRGTIRDHVTLRRRPFVRFFACEQDLSLEPPETPLPDAVTKGAEPFLIIGAMAGG